MDRPGHCRRYQNARRSHRFCNRSAGGAERINKNANDSASVVVMRIGAVVALRRPMSAQAAFHAGEAQQDGFGTRRIEQDPQAGRVEVLQVAAALSRPAAEQGIRARAARFTHGKTPALATVHRIGRGGNSLSVTTAIPAGVTLADLLGALEFGTVSLPD